MVLLLLCSFLFFYRLGDRDLTSSHEARAAQNAQTILQTGHWGLARLFDGHPELQKPPLYYWLTALTAQLHGGTVDAWTVRLPAAVSALAGVLLLFIFLARRGRLLAGFVAALVLATAVHYTWTAHVGRIDMPLTLCISVALWSFVEADNSARLRGRLAGQVIGYLAIAGAVLLKGPIGVVLPAAVLFARTFVEGRWRDAWRLTSLWWGVPLVLLLSGPWFWWVNRETHGRFFEVFFWHHNVERGLGGSEDLAVHPWWYYGPRLFVDFLPWSPLLLAAGWYWLRQGRWRADADARLGLVWLIVMFAGLSCAGFKRADYLLPAYPGAALLLGCAAERWYQTARQPRRLLAALGVVVLAYGLGWWYYLGHVLPVENARRDQWPFARAIRDLAPAPRDIVFFRAEAHALAFHLGKPVATLLEWENLDRWAGKPRSNYILMPPDCAADWPQYLTSGRLEPVLDSTDLTPGQPPDERLILMRTVSHRQP
ncbi:MAG: glycosyltransferase family 39 protein [Planctomycetia bacterium]|nr:glycosyltransferase family 39 protein [Planctomycetia bacterium]